MSFFKLPFLNEKLNKQSNEQLFHDNLPKHVAIIMDGNGRWANKRGLPRIAGHKQGMDNIKNIVKAANSYQIKTLTLYAFSTENWKRPTSEVDFILKLPKEFLTTYLPELIEENVKIETMGDFEGLPIHTKQAVLDAKERTKNNDGLLLNIALNYGSRYEIIQAVKFIANDVQANNVTIDDINEELISKYLYTKEVGDPDLLIRTSGEHRLSNFLLWQSAYTEFWFTDAFWPDFNENLFKKALYDYQSRKRRFGGI